MNTHTRHENLKLPVLLACVTVIISITWIPYLQTLFFHLSFGDEGFTVESARRILNGQLPYRDFFMGVTPGAFYWSALFMKMIGPSLLAVRIGMLVTSSMILAMTLLVLKQLKIDSRLAYLMVAAYLAYYGGPYWFIASHHWLALAMCLFSLYFMLSRDGNKSDLYKDVLAGMMAAAAAATIQHLGGIWILGVIAGLSLSPGAENRKRAAAFTGGVLLLALPLATVFISAVGIKTLYYDLIIFPLTRYHEIGGHHGFDFSYILEIWNAVTSAWQVQRELVDFFRAITLSFVLFGLIIVHLMPLAGTIALASLWKDKVYSRTNLMLLTVFFCAQYLVAVNRLSDHTLAFASPAALLVIIPALRQRQHKRRQDPGSGWLIPAALTLFTITFTSALAYQVLIPKNSTLTPAGPVATITPAEHQTLQGLNSFFSARKGATESVFCYPYSPMIYFLFHSDNPTPYDVLVYPMSTPEHQTAARNLLEEKRNRWVVMTSRIEGDPFEKYLFETYRPVIQLPYALIMERRSQ